MSNVLVGIIGVILFIGLALAGALYLGPKFQNATQNAKASTVVQQNYQVAHAINLQYTTTSTLRPANQALDDLMSQGYLKALPKGPYGGSPFTVDASFSNSGPTVYVAEAFGNTPDAQKTCLAIEALYHFHADGSIPEEADPNIGQPQAGCLHDTYFGLGYVGYVKV